MAAGDVLAAMAARLRDLTPVTTVAAADTATLIDDSFAGSVSPSGEAYAPLSPTTIARRRSASSTPLVDTGRLRASTFARGERNGLVFGTNTAYGRYHQQGTADIAQRAFLPVTLSGGGWTLTMTGPAGSHWARVRAAISHYIRTGEVRL